MNFTVNNDWELFRQLLPFMIPYTVIYLVVTVMALVHIFRHDRYKVGNRWLWLFIVLFFQLIGCVLYFVLGRTDEESD